MSVFPPKGVLLADIAILVSLAFAASVTGAPRFPATKDKCRHTKDVSTDSLCTWIDGLVPEAVARAEKMGGYPIDPSRFDIELVETKAKPHDRYTRMQVYGRDKLRLRVLIEPIFRGDYENADAFATSLTHEFIHIAVRQQLSDRAYSQLPEWFQEGLPTYWLDQWPVKLARTLAPCEHHQKIVRACVDGGTAFPYICGSYFFVALAQDIDAEELQQRVQQVVATGSVDALVAQSKDGFAIYWSRAGELLEKDIIDATGGDSPDFCACQELSNQGRKTAREAISCWAEFRAKHDGLAISEGADYWEAKAHYHSGDFQTAQKMFADFLMAADSSSLVDDALFFRMKSLYLAKMYDESMELCREFLQLYPESPKRPDALEAYWRLTAWHGK